MSLSDELRDNQGLVVGAAAGLLAYHKAGLSALESAAVGYAVMVIVERQRAARAKAALTSSPHGMEARPSAEDLKKVQTAPRK